MQALLSTLQAEKIQSGKEQTATRKHREQSVLISSLSVIIVLHGTIYSHTNCSFVPPVHS